MAVVHEDKLDQRYVSEDRSSRVSVPVGSRYQHTADVRLEKMLSRTTAKSRALFRSPTISEKGGHNIPTALTTDFRPLCEQKASTETPPGPEARRCERASSSSPACDNMTRPDVSIG